MRGIYPRLFTRIPLRIQGKNYSTNLAAGSFSVTPISVKKGDIVELGSNVWGIVSFCGLEKFDVDGLDGNKHVCALKDVRFALRPRSPYQRQDLQFASERAHELATVYKPYSRVLYAFYARDHRANAFDFGDACELLLRCKYKHERPTPPTVQQVLGIYFLLQTSQNFQRLEKSPLGSPFAARPLIGAPGAGNPFRAALGPTRQTVGPGIPHRGPEFPAASFSRPDIGYSLETQYDRFKLNIYLPLVPWRSPLSSTGPRGISLPRYPVVDSSIRARYGLRRQRTETSCLVISALVNPWNNKVVEKYVQVGQTYGEYIPNDFFSQTTLFDRKRHDDLANIQQVFSALAPAPQRSDFERFLIGKDSLLNRQARHLASVWGGEWAAENGADLCFLRKEKLKPVDEISNEDAVDTEILTSEPGPHEYLNAKAYAPLGFVFDSSISAVNAAALAMHVSPDKPHSLKHVSRDPLAQVYRRLALPNKQLADCIFDAGRRYDVLKRLHRHIPVFFRCTVLEKCAAGGQTTAYCHDLRFNIKIRAQAALDVGDSVVCTKVLEKDPSELHLLVQ